MEVDTPRLPIGINDFRTIREGGYHYIDKTGLISRMVDNGPKSILFTRPRGTGRTLNLSMVDSFFNLEHRGNTWFEGLEVMDNLRAVSMMNDHPVVHISLEGLETDTFGSFLDDFRERIRTVSRRFGYLRDMVPCVPRRKVSELMDGDASEAALRRSLANLSNALSIYHGRRTVILIDGFDGPINGSHGTDGHLRIIGFVRSLLYSTLNGNGGLEFGMVTGVMQMAEDSALWDLNICCYTILDQQYNTMFGLTEREVLDTLTLYGHPEGMEEVRERYAGHLFGGTVMYNPVDILNYIDRGFRTGPYWLDEGDHDRMRECLEWTGALGLDTISELYNDGRVGIRGWLVIPNFFDLFHSCSISRALVWSGYLDVVRLELKRWEARIVNKEVEDNILDRLIGDDWDRSALDRMSDAVLKGSPDDVERALSDLLDSGREDDTEYFQPLYLGLLDRLRHGYRVIPEYNRGMDPSVIAIIPRGEEVPSAILVMRDEPEDTGDEMMVGMPRFHHHEDLRGELHLYDIAIHRNDSSVTYRKVVR